MWYLKRPKTRAAAPMAAPGRASAVEWSSGGDCGCGGAAGRDCGGRAIEDCHCSVP